MTPFQPSQEAPQAWRENDVALTEQPAAVGEAHSARRGVRAATRALLAGIAADAPGAGRAGCAAPSSRLWVGPTVVGGAVATTVPCAAS